MRRTLTVFALVLGLAAAGCSKKKNDDGGGGGTGSAPAAGTGSAPAAGTGSAPAMGSGSAAATSDKPAGITPELLAAHANVHDTLKASIKDLEAAGTDCAKMATALDGATGKLKPEIDKLAAILEKLDPASDTYYSEKLAPEMGPTFESMDPITAKCKDDPGVQEAAKRYVTALTGE